MKTRVFDLERRTAKLGDDAVSPRDFHHKIGICRKEARETQYWCQMLAKAVPNEKDVIRLLWKEARELNLIFSSIFRKTAA